MAKRQCIYQLICDQFNWLIINYQLIFAENFNHKKNLCLNLTSGSKRCAHVPLNWNSKSKKKSDPRYSNLSNSLTIPFNHFARRWNQYTWAYTASHTSSLLCWSYMCVSSPHRSSHPVPYGVRFAIRHFHFHVWIPARNKTIHKNNNHHHICTNIIKTARMCGKYQCRLNVVFSYKQAFETAICVCVQCADTHTQSITH